MQFRVERNRAPVVEKSSIYYSCYIPGNPINQLESYIADALDSAQIPLSFCKTAQQFDLCGVAGQFVGRFQDEGQVA